jgi:hypothetical protein
MDPSTIFHPTKHIAEVSKGKLIPQEKVFSKIKPLLAYPLSLHSQLKIGNLLF